MGQLRNDTHRRAEPLRVGLLLAALVLGLGSVVYARSAEATFKGRPGLVAFDSSVDPNCGSGSVYLARPDLTQRRLLTDGGASVAFSPDGKKLIFNSPCHVGTDIVQVNVDGSDKRVLISGKPLSASSGSFAPDGRHIAFLKTATPGGGSDTDVWTARADGTGQRQLTAGRAKEKDDPSGRFARASAHSRRSGERLPQWTPDRLCEIQLASQTALCPATRQR